MHYIKKKKKKTEVRHNTKKNFNCFISFSISIHGILWEDFFLGEAIKAAIWDFPFPS